MLCVYDFLAFICTTEQVKVNPKALGCRTEARNIIRWCEMKTFRKFWKDGRFYAMPIRTMKKFAVLCRQGLAKFECMIFLKNYLQVFFFYKKVYKFKNIYKAKPLLLSVTGGLSLSV